MSLTTSSNKIGTSSSTFAPTLLPCNPKPRVVMDFGLNVAAPAVIPAQATKKRALEEGISLGDDKATESLIALLIKQCLSNSQQIRALRAICLEVVRIKTSCTLISTLKATTTEHHEKVKGMSPVERRAVGVAHLHVWGSFITWTKGAFPAISEKITEYMEWVNGDRNKVLDTIKLCRVAKNFDREFKKLEINVVVGTPSAEIWSLIKSAMVQDADTFAMLPGVAPEGGMEKRLQQWLESYGKSSR